MLAGGGGDEGVYGDGSGGLYGDGDGGVYSDEHDDGDVYGDGVW